MDIINVEYLIRIYDAAEELLELCQKMTGYTLDEDSVVYEILIVSEVLKRISPLYDDPNVDWEDSKVARILNDRKISARKRALMLFGLSE